MNTRNSRSAALATTAAASAALPQLAIASGAGGPPTPLPRRRSLTSRYSMTPKRCRPLCEPETLPVSSLTQRPLRPEPEARASAGAALRQGSRGSRVRRRPRRRASSSATSVQNSRVGQSADRGKVGTEYRRSTVADERLRARGRRRSASPVRVARRLQNVIDVIVPGRAGRTSERIGRARRPGDAGVPQPRRRRPDSRASPRAGRRAAVRVELRDHLVPRRAAGRAGRARTTGAAAPRTPPATRPAVRPTCSSRD